MKKKVLVFALLFFACVPGFAGAESSAHWNAGSIQLSGYWEEDIVAVAQSLIDYEIRTAEREAVQTEDRNWTADFVTFCVHYAGIPLDISADSIMELKKKGIRYRSYHTARNHPPEKGDIFFACEEEKAGGRAYCGIVEQVTQTVIYTIEGDENARIVRRVYFKDDPLIDGYISIWDLMRADGIIVIEENSPVTENLSEETAGKKKETMIPAAASGEDEYFFLLNPAS